MVIWQCRDPPDHPLLSAGDPPDHPLLPAVLLPPADDSPQVRQLVSHCQHLLSHYSPQLRQLQLTFSSCSLVSTAAMLAWAWRSWYSTAS